MIDIFPDYDALSEAAAGVFAQHAENAVLRRGRFTVALAGGHTPVHTYELLSRAPYRHRVPWGKTHIFWGDERCVPADDPRSNQRMAQQALLGSVPVPLHQIHPIDGTLPPYDAAQSYEDELREFFGDQPPHLDLVLLGLGENGHTASLFPSTPAIHEKTRWVMPVSTPETDLPRITMTPALLNQAAAVVFLVSGASKADMLRRVLEGNDTPDDVPAQVIRPIDGAVHWLVDRAAAAKLSSEI